MKFKNQQYDFISQFQLTKSFQCSTKSEVTSLKSQIHVVSILSITSSTLIISQSSFPSHSDTVICMEDTHLSKVQTETLHKKAVNYVRITQASLVQSRCTARSHWYHRSTTHQWKRFTRHLMRFVKKVTAAHVWQWPKEKTWQLKLRTLKHNQLKYLKMSKLQNRYWSCSTLTVHFY